MKRLMTGLFVLIMLFGLTGCQWMEAPFMKTDLTANQKNILVSILVDVPEDGKAILSAAERRLADIIGKVEAYLAARYPNRTFVLNGLTSVFYKQPVNTITAESDGIAFEISVTTEQDDLSDIIITDGLYSFLKEEEAGALIEQMFAENGIAGAKASVKLIGIYDERYDPASSLSSCLESGLPLRVTGSVFTDSNHALTVESVQAMMAKKNIEGTLRVWLMESVPAGTPDDTWVQNYCQTNATKLFVTQ